MSDRIFGIDAADVPEAGGKARNLCVLRSLGALVPDAFVLSSRFFDEVAKSTGLDVLVENALREANGRNIADIAARIRDGIEGVEIPERLAAEAYAFFDGAGFTRAAVRSSAIGEDGDNDAFAGMLDSFLGVERAGVLDAVKRCFASMYNERCLTYRAAKGLSLDFGMAVIVQKMIYGDFSGVIFSSDPTTLDDAFVIEYTEGMGDRLVSGAVTPRRIKADRNYKIIESDAPRGEAGFAAALCAETDRIRAHYGRDADVEFAVSGGRLYILQCRPVTTSDRLQTLVNARERVFYVKRPFSWLFETFQKAAFDAERQERVLGFRLNTDNYLIVNGSEYYDARDHASDLERFDSLYAADGDFFGGYAKKVFGIIADAERYTERLETERFSANDAELAARLDEFARRYTDCIVPSFARPDDYLEEKFTAALAAEGMFTEELKHKACECAACYPKRYAPLSYVESVSSLLKMAEKCARGESYDDDLDRHVERFGWMKGPLDARLKRFTKREYVKEIEEAARARTFERKTRDDGLDDTVAEIERALSAYPRLAALFDSLRDFVYLRTKLTETTDRMFYVFRTTLLEQIRRRAGVGDGYIVSLGADEIADLLLNGADHSRAVGERRKGYCLLKFGGRWRESFGDDVNAVFERLEKERDRRAKADESGMSELRGRVATRGYAEGKARIIKSADDLRAVRRGEIVVASMTTPEYIFAIEKAAGFITDEGGITCHAAIISREFGIPCVVGTRVATDVLENGLSVELDAYDGVVRYGRKKRSSV